MQASRFFYWGSRHWVWYNHSIRHFSSFVIWVAWQVSFRIEVEFSIHRLLYLSSELVNTEFRKFLGDSLDQYG
jgi:hypothetical protein